MDLFDKYMNIVPGININFLSCIFQYNNKTWRVECWKGEYGPTAGGEVGLYVLDGTMSLSQYFQKMRCDGAVFTGTEAFDKLFSMIKIRNRYLKMLHGIEQRILANTLV